MSSRSCTLSHCAFRSFSCNPPMKVCPTHLHVCWTHVQNTHACLQKALVPAYACAEEGVVCVGYWKRETLISSRSCSFSPCASRSLSYEWMFDSFILPLKLVCHPTPLSALQNNVSNDPCVNHPSALQGYLAHKKQRPSRTLQ